jgi:hypothetical protein
MAANNYGLSSLVFGAPAVTGYVVQSNAVSSKCGVVVPVADENGIIVQRRYDDVTSEVNFEAVFNGATIPTPGITFTVDSVEYIVETTDVKRENKGNKTVSIKGITSQGITLS